MQKFMILNIGSGLGWGRGIVVFEGPLEAGADAGLVLDLLGEVASVQAEGEVGPVTAEEH